MNSEKKIICVGSARKNDSREKSYLNASSQSSQSVSNICSSPEMCPVNDAVFQRAKLYRRMQMRDERYGDCTTYEKRLIKCEHYDEFD